jgi:hypothetical protein
MAIGDLRKMTNTELNWYHDNLCNKLKREQGESGDEGQEFPTAPVNQKSMVLSKVKFE